MQTYPTGYEDATEEELFERQRRERLAEEEQSARSASERARPPSPSTEERS